MRLSAMFNDDVAYDLGLTLEDTYILGYLYKISTTTEDTMIIGGSECFTFNLVELFKSRKRIFEQIPKDIEKKFKNEDKLKEEIQRVYELNRRRFDRIMKKNLKKVLKKVKNIKTNEGSKTYYRIDRMILKILIDGYPVKEDREFTEIEKDMIDKLPGMKITKSISSQLKNMDKDVLNEAIEVAIETEIYDYPYVRSVYNNLVKQKVVEGNKKAANAANVNDHQKNTYLNSNVNNSIQQNVPKNNTKPKTKFHNCNESFSKFTPEGLEQHLLNMQKDKFK